MQLKTLAFEMTEEVLAARIIITVGLSGMRDDNAMIIKITDKHYVCVLESLIGMKNTESCAVPVLIDHLCDGIHNQLQIIKLRDLIGYNGIVIKVLDHTEI